MYETTRKCIYKALGIYDKDDCCAYCSGFGVFFSNDSKRYVECVLYKTLAEAKEDIKHNTALYRYVESEGKYDFLLWGR